MTKRDFALTALQDIAKIRTAAKRARRQTGRRAPGTGRSRSEQDR